MLSWLQPDSACAGEAPHAATAARASGVSFARIIILDVPYSAHPDRRRRRVSSLRPGGRLVDAADEALQAKRQSTPLLFREKAAQLALAAVRLDGEPARVLLSCGAAQFNLRPMPREHDACAALAHPRLDAHVGLGDGDALAVEAPLEGQPERPAEQCHLQSGERQDRPEALAREKHADPERDDAGGGEEHLRRPHAERAVRADLDAQRFAVHVRLDGKLRPPYSSCRKLMALRASRAAAASSVSEEAAPGSQGGAIARAGSPSSRSSEARFSAVRAMSGSVPLAIQPAKLTPRASIASRVSCARFS